MHMKKNRSKKQHKIGHLKAGHRKAGLRKVAHRKVAERKARHRKAKVVKIVAIKTKKAEPAKPLVKELGQHKPRERTKGQSALATAVAEDELEERRRLFAKARKGDKTVYAHQKTGAESLIIPRPLLKVTHE
jgi:hypothetical protein